MNGWIKLLATFFYLGEVPFAPGTVGSLAGVYLYLIVAESPWLCASLFVFIVGVGFFSAGRAEKIFGKKDPREVVIDEVAGVFLVFFMVPLHGVNIVLGFLLYRILDILKPFPVRQFERLRGSSGIMADDLMCGIYANLILHGLLKLSLLH